MGSVLSGFLVLFGKCESILKAKKAEQYSEQVNESTSHDSSGSSSTNSGAEIEANSDMDTEKKSTRGTQGVRYEFVLWQWTSYVCVVNENGILLETLWKLPVALDTVCIVCD